MSNAMRHTLLWSVALASLTACGGGDGEGVVDGFSVASNTGSARATAAMQPGWAASTAGADQRYGEGGGTLIEGDGAPAFAHAACSEASCDTGDNNYPQIERRVMYDDRPQMADAVVSAPEDPGSPGRYAAVGDHSAWGEGARPNGVE